MTVPSQGSPYGGSGSQRGPIIVLGLLVLVVIGLLVTAVVLGLRLLSVDDSDRVGASGSASGERPNPDDIVVDSSRPTPDDVVPTPPPSGSVRFRLVEEQHPLGADGSCPNGDDWTAHETQCLRLGRGFSATATAEGTFETGYPSVNVILEPPADEKFEAFTREYQGRQIAILADAEVVTAPVVEQPISGGEVQISADFTVEEARELAASINGQ